MPRRLAIPRLVSLGMALSSGCAANHLAPIARHVPTTKPAATAAEIPATRPVVPFVYSHWFDEVLPPIPAAEEARVLAEAEKVKPRGVSIWFVLVREDTSGRGRQWTTAAEVYYTPDLRTPSFRAGRWARIYETDSFASGEPEINRYVQVSPPDRPFGTQLEVPEAKWLPVGDIEDVPNEDIVALVDAARAALNKETLSEAKSEPIGRIARDAGRYRIDFGWFVDVWSTFYELQKSHGRFGVVTSGIGAL